MSATRYDNRKRGRRLVAQSGDTRFFLTPGNMIGHGDKLEVDTAALSGQVGPISIQLRDSYAPLAAGAENGSSTTQIRKEINLIAGESISLNLDAETQFFGGVDVRSSKSGPIVSLSVWFN